MPENLVFRRKIWGARDNGIPPRSTPAVVNRLSLYYSRSKLDKFGKNSAITSSDACE